MEVISAVKGRLLLRHQSDISVLHLKVEQGSYSFHLYLFLQWSFLIRIPFHVLQEVTCVDFHPDASKQILASGSKDFTIKFFDFSNPSVKKAQRSLPEASPIKTLHFHPSGDYLTVGTHQKTRMLHFS